MTQLKYINTKHIRHLKLFVGLAIVFLTSACENTEPRFKRMDAAETGVTFSNMLTETPQMNIFTYLYFYNGGGVAAGDLNGNGYPDLYFTSNMEENKLYINQGDFKFEDITESAGVKGQKGWTTGVTMADVNGDGKLDIYVSQLGDYKNLRGKNQLYINMGNDENGNPVFEDQAKQWGLDLVGFSTQAAFFDYDNDGDLDMFMLNHSVHSNGTYGKSSLRFEKHKLSGDKLLRNDGDKFTDVTDEAGIYSSVIGYGLGVTIGDVNWDGYPDIYVGNDFHENDYLYINNGDGTFTEQLEQSMGHTSRFSMGNDIGDINNDGFPDIISMDMLPAEVEKLKASAAEDPYEMYDFKLGFGYNHQYARNTLQLNHGNGLFSEIGFLAGVAATDWSWSALFADLDLDGNKDIFITNGIKRRMNDLDYINFISNDAVQSRLEGDLTDEDLALVEKMPVVKIPNYAFQNSGALKFENVSSSWGLDENSFSNGAVYVDLDNDGDLDLVVNNVDQEAFIYQNQTIHQEEIGNNYLKIRFEGKKSNTFGIGAKVIIPMGNHKIVQELFPTRGYLSAVAPELVIGLGQLEQADSLIVIWPDHSFEVLQNIDANQTLTLQQGKASGKYDFNQKSEILFEDISETLAIDYQHKENKFIEFNREPLIPHMSSTEGPKIAVGDINGDGLEDFFIGGAKLQPGSIFIQTDNGFEAMPQPSLNADSLQEDIGAAFVDVNNDGALDLIVVSGGNEFQHTHAATQPRLYLNDGNGNLSRDDNAFKDIHLTGSVVKVVDFNKNGYPDLFIGGRVIPWNYGDNPSSFLLINDGKGNYTNETASLAPDLSALGMVKDAIWADIDGDGLEDLVVVGDWMSVTVLLQKDGKLSKTQISGLENSEGWWNTLAIEDLNGDGIPDLIVGNLGENSKLKASKDEPISLYIDDFDDNDQKEQLMFHYVNGEKQLYASKDELGKQLPSLKSRFLKYTDFAKAKPEAVFSDEQLKNARKLEAFELRSGVYMSGENKNYTFQPFPVQAQFAPINAFFLDDMTGNGQTDVLSMGNFFEVNIQRGRYDADYGSLMSSSEDGVLEWMPARRSGLQVKGQVRDIQEIIYQGEKALLIAKNNETLQIIRLKHQGAKLLTQKEL